jgi:hypothetical protein
MEGERRSLLLSTISLAGGELPSLQIGMDLCGNAH